MIFPVSCFVSHCVFPKIDVNEWNGTTHKRDSHSTPRMCSSGSTTEYYRTMRIKCVFSFRSIGKGKYVEFTKFLADICGVNYSIGRNLTLSNLKCLHAEGAWSVVNMNHKEFIINIHKMNVLWFIHLKTPQRLSIQPTKYLPVTNS